MDGLIDPKKVADAAMERLRHDPRMRRTFWDDLVLKENMKDALREAVGTRRADEISPPSMDTIKIRRPNRYQHRTKEPEWME